MKQKLKKLNSGRRNTIISHRAPSSRGLPTYRHRFRLKQMKTTQRCVVSEGFSVSQSGGRRWLASNLNACHLLSVLNLIKTRARLQRAARGTLDCGADLHGRARTVRGEKPTFADNRKPALSVRRGGEPFFEETRHGVLYSALWKEPPSPSKCGRQTTWQNLG